MPRTHGSARTQTASRVGIIREAALWRRVWTWAALATPDLPTAAFIARCTVDVATCQRRITPSAPLSSFPDGNTSCHAHSRPAAAY